MIELEAIRERSLRRSSVWMSLPSKAPAGCAPRSTTILTRTKRATLVAVWEVNLCTPPSPKATIVLARTTAFQRLPLTRPAYVSSSTSHETMTRMPTRMCCRWPKLSTTAKTFFKERSSEACCWLTTRRLSVRRHLPVSISLILTRWASLLTWDPLETPLARRSYKTVSTKVKMVLTCEVVSVIETLSVRRGVTWLRTLKFSVLKENQSHILRLTAP